MSDKDLFEEPKEPEQPKNTEVTPSEPQTDPFADKLQEIRNESGEPKYRDVPTALDALKNSQQFIEQLKQEKRELEEKYNKTQSELERMGAIEEYVEKLKPSNANADQPKETPKGDGGLSERESHNYWKSVCRPVNNRPYRQLILKRLWANSQKLMATMPLSLLSNELRN